MNGVPVLERLRRFRLPVLVAVLLAACPYTAYRDARRFAERSRSPLLTVRGGGPGRGDACQALTAHGFVGVERETVLAMRSWVKTGMVPLPTLAPEGARPVELSAAVRVYLTSTMGFPLQRATNS